MYSQRYLYYVCIPIYNLIFLSVIMSNTTLYLLELFFFSNVALGLMFVFLLFPLIFNYVGSGGCPHTTGRIYCLPREKEEEEEDYDGKHTTNN